MNDSIIDTSLAVLEDLCISFSFLCGDKWRCDARRSKGHHEEGNRKRAEKNEEWGMGGRRWRGRIKTYSLHI